MEKIFKGGSNLKVFISADIEGVAGIANWTEARRSSPDYDYFARQMTGEVAAACEGANMAGARDILVKDAHGLGRNIDPSKLPENVRLIRGWSGHPYKMLQGLDKSFHAVGFIGYHSHGGSDTNPLAHTINSSVIDYIKMNGQYLSEFSLHAYIASYLGVPVAFLSGDKGICSHGKELNENITTIETLEGCGDSTISIHPNKSKKIIKDRVKKSLENNLSNNHLKLPKEFTLEIKYKSHGDSYRNSFYPGAIHQPPSSILFKTDDFFEIIRITSFVI